MANFFQKTTDDTVIGNLAWRGYVYQHSKQYVRIHAINLILPYHSGLFWPIHGYNLVVSRGEGLQYTTLFRDILSKLYALKDYENSEPQRNRQI